MMTSVIRPCFTTHHQTCKTKINTNTTACKTWTNTEFFGLRPVFS